MAIVHCLVDAALMWSRNVAAQLRKASCWQSPFGRIKLQILHSDASVRVCIQFLKKLLNSWSIISMYLDVGT